MLGAVYSSTSTENKISVDVELRNLIKIEADKHVIMLVGAPDGLERHYQNVLSWGGTVKNLTIVDISEHMIRALELYHDQNLCHYDRPRFVVSDLNEVLASWDRGQIGVIDFDGTTGIKADYHLRTLLHAERLLADYLIIVASARIQDPGMIAFGEKLAFVTRKVYINKEQQEKIRSSYSPSYTQPQYTLQSTHGILNDLVKGRGHSLVKAQAYKGVSPMVISVIKISKVDPKSYFQTTKNRCMCCEELFSEEWEIASKDYNLATVGCDIENQLIHQQKEKTKDLFKCPRDNFGKYQPTDEWWLKYEPETFKVLHPERHRIALCKTGVKVRPYSFTSTEEAELVEWYNHCLTITDGDVKLIRKMIESHCKAIYRDYDIVRARLVKLGKWKNLYKTGPRMKYQHQEVLA